MMSQSSKSIEQTYQKKTQLEHILLRPDTYVGSLDSATLPMWVVNPETARFENRTITYVPGLYKIFDEILVNAADNKQRDPSMNLVDIQIDVEAGSISIMNNGSGIPVVVHQEHKVYVPELIFGHLLTGSNYDDVEKKTTGGRNGYGAKLANIFSTKFIIETLDPDRKLKYRQEFRDNLSVIEQPQLTCLTEKQLRVEKSFTRVTFFPDLRRFRMSHLDSDIVALFTKRAYDLAGCVNGGVTVQLNGLPIRIKNFLEYVRLYPVSGELAYEKAGDRWEYAVCVSDGQFQSVSFVNAIATTNGGSHVSYIADQIVSELLDPVKKKAKSADVKPHMVKNFIWIFLNALIENPSFDSQTKETLTTKHQNFGSAAKVSEKFVKSFIKLGIVDKVAQWSNFKASTELKKTDGSKKTRLSGIPKLDDANEAGGRNSLKCTLILTEGDSAKALAVSGLSVVGRDYYGVFPLRGKLLNVREASPKQIADNAEITALKQILGLKQGKSYDTEKELKELRYGHMMIMTDQDHDGSHIKGLIINFLHCYWPSLLKHPGFLMEFVTPIVKCIKGKVAEVFFTIPEYESWYKSIMQKNELRGWSIKYYKGLGTSTAAEAREYFRNLPLHEKAFSYGPATDADIELAFSKKKADERKAWLARFEPGTFLDHSQSLINYSEFINKELILFSVMDNQRSIPSVMDGFKPGHRKVLFACFKRKLKQEIKVAQLAGYVAEHSAYHHGEQSLASTIVGMAQNFVGSNNINLLFPSGQFGTRIAGGSDAASARYIFTRLSLITRLLFPEDDDPLLSYLEDDGQKIEPTYYVPIIPMVLVNGAKGIGTGWSTEVPTFNPKDLIHALRTRLQRDMSTGSSEMRNTPQKNILEDVELIPWFRGFNGVVTPTDDEGSSFYVTGRISKVASDCVEITELPIGFWTQKYKEFLEEKVTEGKLIRDYKDYHSDTSVRFLVYFVSDGILSELLAGGAAQVAKILRLATSVTLSNMILFDEAGHIKRYTDVTSIVDEFFRVRMKFYAMRKKYMVEELSKEFKRLDNRMKFILAVLSGELKIHNRKKADIVQDLVRQKYDVFDDSKKVDESENNDDQPMSSVEKGYEYLFSMPLSSLTFEKVQQLKIQREEKERSLQQLIRTDHRQMWIQDLDALEKGLDEYESELLPAEENAPRDAKPKRKSKKADDSFEMNNDSDDDDYAKASKKTKAKKSKNEPLAVPVELGGEEIALDVLPKRKPTSKGNSVVDVERILEFELDPVAKPKKTVKKDKFVFSESDENEPLVLGNESEDSDGDRSEHPKNDSFALEDSPTPVKSRPKQRETSADADADVKRKALQMKVALQAATAVELNAAKKPVARKRATVGEDEEDVAAVPPAKKGRSTKKEEVSSMAASLPSVSTDGMFARLLGRVNSGNPTVKSALSKPPPVIANADVPKKTRARAVAKDATTAETRKTAKSKAAVSVIDVDSDGSVELPPKPLPSRTRPVRKAVAASKKIVDTESDGDDEEVFEEIDDDDDDDDYYSD
eukprot:ANDGO_00062.mRNA.1 DNA topoisomerase 2